MSANQLVHGDASRLGIELELGNQMSNVESLCELWKAQTLGLRCEWGRNQNEPTKRCDLIMKYRASRALRYVKDTGLSERFPHGSIFGEAVSRVTIVNSQKP